MTVLELIKQVKQDLGKIPVRVEDIDIIGNPIHAAVINLGIAVEAIENVAKADKEKQEAQDAENADDQPGNV